MKQDQARQPFASFYLDQLKRGFLGLTDEDYRSFRPDAPPPPPPGYVLFNRRPQSPAFKITWSSGETKNFLGDATRLFDQLERLGITRERAERALNHIWNFQYSYVKLVDSAPEKPPLRLPRLPARGK